MVSVTGCCRPHWPHGGFNGVAVVDDAIYVSSDIDNAVYEFTRGTVATIRVQPPSRIDTASATRIWACSIFSW